MVRDSETCDSGLNEEETAIILFGEELKSIFCSGFDGSKEELHIFADIFYGGSLQDESNCCAVTGMSNSARHGSRCCGRKACIKFNLENSNISSNSSMKGSSGEGLELTKVIHPKAEHMLQSSTSWAGSGAVKLNSKKNNSSCLAVLDQGSNAHCCSYPWKKNKLIQSDSQSYQPCSLRVVESFAHGILSSYYSVQPGNVDVASDVDHLILNYKSSVQHIGEGKVGLEANIVTSPVSQESSAYGLLKGGPILEDKGKSGVAACTDNNTLETIKGHPSGGRSKRVTNTEMPGRLECYAHSLLVDAGWSIEPRVRKERSKMAYLFRKPDEGLVRASLSSAWKTCGERLLYTESESDDKGREWSDINEFWNDLKEIFACIDMETQLQENRLSLLRRWQLLDPFLAVVFISRKISVLRMGKLVRAVRSATFIPDFSEGIVGNLNGSRKRKSKTLSSKYKSTERYSIGHNPRDFLNNYVYDTPVTSDLESEDPSGCSIQDELHQETTNIQHMSSLHQQENRFCVQRNGFPSNDKLNHGFSLGSSTKVYLHVEGEDALSSKETSPINMFNSSPKKIHKSKTKSDFEETEVSVRKRRSGSKGKHEENSAYCLYGSNLPCLETSDVLTSECLEPTVCVNRQSGNVLSTSEDESTHTSEIQEACSTMETYKKNLEFEDEEAGKVDDNKKGFPLMPLEEKPLINFSSLNEGQDDRQFNKFMEIECNAQLMSSINHSPVRSCYRLLSKSRKIQEQGSSSKEQFVTVLCGNIPKSPRDSREALFSTTDGLCPGFEKSRKVSKSHKLDDQKRTGLKRGFYVNDDDLLIAAIIKKKDFGTSCKKFPSKPEFSQPKGSRKLKGQNWDCGLLPRSLGSDGKLLTDGKQFVMGARTVLGWLIDAGAVSLRDVVQFHNPKNHEVIKDGWVMRDGILCKCCTQVFSVSDFKAHAGFRQQRPLNLYLQSGKSFTLCQLQAWSAEYKSRKRRLKVMNVVEVDQNDDTCGICADGGELICCDNCPSTYHQSCLSIQELPEGSWYCSNCICKICKNLACNKENSSSLAVFECAQCKHKYHEACIIDKIVHKGDAESRTWFCGENCKAVFLGLRSRVGMLNLIDDGLSWTILRCNHDDQNVYSPQKIALMAECNSKLAIALSLMEECFLPMVDPRTGIDMVPHVLYNWGSDFARLNYEGFYTVILEKGDTLISVASVRVHGVKVAEMPLIATCGLQRRQKMCRRLMNSIEMMLRSFKVEMIVLSAIPSLVETWVSGFGFSVINTEEKELLRDINLLLFPGTVLLQKKLCEASVLQTGGDDQVCNALADFDKEKYEDEDRQSVRDSGLGLDVEYMLSTSLNLEQPANESPPRSASTPFWNPYSKSQGSESIGILHQRIGIQEH